MIVDLHAHTFYSGCGRDAPEALVLAMIHEGVEVFGITDHDYGIGERRVEYVRTVRALAQKYQSKIRLLCGIEIATTPHHCLNATQDYAEFDYCLIEHLDSPESVMQGDIVAFTKGFSCPVGIAHTDLFAFIKARNSDPFSYLSSLAQANIFWEMNVNFDSIHGYREHRYVKEFLESREQQQLVRASGIKISVGFDGHRMEDYLVDRVRDMNQRLSEMGITPYIPYAKQ